MNHDKLIELVKKLIQSISGTQADEGELVKEICDLMYKQEVTQVDFREVERLVEKAFHMGNLHGLGYNVQKDVEIKKITDSLTNLEQFKSKKDENNC